jgi:hypothetical protein
MKRCRLAIRPGERGEASAKRRPAPASRMYESGFILTSMINGGYSMIVNSPQFWPELRQCAHGSLRRSCCAAATAAGYAMKRAISFRSRNQGCRVRDSRSPEASGVRLRPGTMSLWQQARKERSCCCGTPNPHGPTFPTTNARLPPAVGVTLQLWGAGCATPHASPTTSSVRQPGGLDRHGSSQKVHSRRGRPSYSSTASTAHPQLGCSTSSDTRRPQPGPSWSSATTRQYRIWRSHWQRPPTQTAARRLVRSRLTLSTE